MATWSRTATYETLGAEPTFDQLLTSCADVSATYDAHYHRRYNRDAMRRSRARRAADR